MGNNTRTIEFGTIVNDAEVTGVGEIISRRANSNVVFALISKPDYTGGPVKHGIYMCRSYTKHMGRKREQRLEWLGELGDSYRAFDARDDAITYAVEVA